MAKYGTMLTSRGEALMANASILGQKINITQFAVGDGNGSYYQPTPDIAALKKEVWRGAVNEVYIDENSPNVIVITAIIPSSIGGFTIREAGAFTKDNILVGIMNTPDIQKVMEGEGADSEQYLRMRLAVSYTDSLSFPTDPTVIIATKNDIVKHDASLTVHAQAFKAFGDGLDASKIKQTAIALPEGVDPNVNNALGSLNEKTKTIISETEPTEPCGIWLKPMGSMTIAGALGGGGGAQPLNISGAYIGEVPPEDKSKIWYKPIESN